MIGIHVLGIVKYTVDLSGLRPSGSQVDVLNGIAFDAERGRIFVTGKLWPKLFQIEVCENTNPTPTPIIQQSSTTFQWTLSATLAALVVATIAVACRALPV